MWAQGIQVDEYWTPPRNSGLGKTYTNLEEVKELWENATIGLGPVPLHVPRGWRQGHLTLGANFERQAPSARGLPAPPGVGGWVPLASGGLSLLSSSVASHPREHQIF